VRRTRGWLAGAALILGVVALLLAWLAGALPGTRGRYRTSDPALAVAWRAKEGCSCRFVQGRSEADCLAWTRASPDVARLRVDHAARTVEARALLLWRARARWAGPRDGCVLE